jgi:diguanylate cyclase (GGDEF)-like protein
MSIQEAHSNLSPVEPSFPPKTDPAESGGFHWWTVFGSIFVLLLFATALFLLIKPSSAIAEMALSGIRLAEAIFGLVVLVALLGFYAIYQQSLIRRLRRQLADKQDHSQVLRNLAMADQLTGLYNRRFAEQRLAAEVSRSSRKGHPLTVVVFDLNNFKMINDKYGHPAGDMVLRKFATHIGNAIRAADFAARMGGDEFLLVLPECSVKQLQLVLSRLGPLQLEWNGQTIPILWSIGWKEYKPGENPDELLSGADHALYENKRASKKSAPLPPGKMQFSKDL